MDPSAAPFVPMANSATTELNAWCAPLATIKRITSLTPTAPSVLSVATSPTESRVIASIAKKESIKMKKPSNFVFLVILGSTLFQSEVQTAMHAKRKIPARSGKSGCINITVGYEGWVAIQALESSHMAEIPDGW